MTDYLGVESLRFSRDGSRLLLREGEQVAVVDLVSGDEVLLGGLPPAGEGPLHAFAGFEDEAWVVAGEPPVLQRFALPGGAPRGEALVLEGVGAGGRLLVAPSGPPAAIWSGRARCEVRREGEALRVLSLPAHGFAVPIEAGSRVLLRDGTLLRAEAAGETSLSGVGQFGGAEVLEGAAILDGKAAALLLERGEAQSLLVMSLPSGAVQHRLPLRGVRAARFAGARGHVLLLSGERHLEVIDLRFGRALKAWDEPAAVLDLALDASGRGLALRRLGSDGAPAIYFGSYRDVLGMGRGAGPTPGSSAGAAAPPAFDEDEREPGTEGEPADADPAAPIDTATTTAGAAPGPGAAAAPGERGEDAGELDEGDPGPEASVGAPPTRAEAGGGLAGHRPSAAAPAAAPPGLSRVATGPRRPPLRRPPPGVPLAPAAPSPSQRGEAPGVPGDASLPAQPRPAPPLPAPASTAPPAAGAPRVGSLGPRRLPPLRRALPPTAPTAAPADAAMAAPAGPADGLASRDRPQEAVGALPGVRLRAAAPHPVFASVTEDAIAELRTRARRRGGGAGVLGVLAGPDGSGRRLAALVVASELGAEVRQVEAAELHEPTVDTLGLLLDEAEAPGVILHLTGAGAFLGGHLGPALLGRLGRFRGVALFSVEKPGSVPPALRRLVATMVPFPRPDVAAREALWRLHLPPSVVERAYLDPALLARHELTGGQIRACVERALLLAEAAATAPGAEHFERAALVAAALEG